MNGTVEFLEGTPNCGAETIQCHLDGQGKDRGEADEAAKGHGVQDAHDPGVLVAEDLELLALPHVGGQPGIAEQDVVFVVKLEAAAVHVRRTD